MSEESPHHEKVLISPESIPYIKYVPDEEALLYPDQLNHDEQIEYLRHPEIHRREAIKYVFKDSTLNRVFKMSDLSEQEAAARVQQLFPHLIEAFDKEMDEALLDVPRMPKEVHDLHEKIKKK